MTIQYINTGTAPNQGNGDTLRTAFTKINSNFEQLANNTIVADAVGSVISDPSLQNGVVVTYNTSTGKASFSLDPADQTNLGGVKIGSGISVTGDGTISAFSGNYNELSNIPQPLATDNSPTFNTVKLSNGISATSGTNLRIAGDAFDAGPVAEFGVYANGTGSWIAGLTVDSQRGISVPGTIYQGTAYDNVEVPGTTIRVDSNQPNYTQAIFKNHSTATTATSDLIIFNNQGTADTNYIDIGINNTNYVEEGYNIHTPGSGYVFTKDVDLVLGTDGVGTKLKFHAGGEGINDSAMELDGAALRINRSVQTIVGTPGPLNFTVWNTQNNSAAQAVYQAMNDQGHYLKMGINSSNAGAEYGAIGPREGFLHIDLSTATLHIGGSGDIKFWSEASTGGYANGTTATLVMSRLDRSSTFGGHVLPAADLQYDLGSSSTQWRSLYVGTATIYIGGIPITVNTASNTLVVGTTPGTTSTTATNLATESFVIDYVGQNGGGGAGGELFKVGIVPASSKGAVGDLAGTVAFSTSSIYYCVQDFGGLEATLIGGYSGGVYPSIIKTSEVKPLTGWTFVFDNTTYTLVADATEPNQGQWQLQVDQTIATTTTTITLTPTDNIWKRVQWSADTW